MKKYKIQNVFCAVSALAIFVGVFLSELNITLGDFLISSGIAFGITSLLLLLVILAFYMKKTNNMYKLYIYRKLEFFSVFFYTFCGLASLLIFNHFMTVWLRTGEIRENLNIRQLENMLPEYEKYANQRIANYENQLVEAISYSNARTQELINLGFNTSSTETLESQKVRKIELLKQSLRNYEYKEFTDTITTQIEEFVGNVDGFSPITAPKNITKIEEMAKYWENRLKKYSHKTMKGEKAEDFQFESTFGNVKDILTGWKDNIFMPQRFLGYGLGIFALIVMLFPYFKVKRSNRCNY